VNIDDGTTEGLMSAPLWSDNWNSDQLVQESVKVTMYGLRNDDAITLRDCVLRYASSYGTFGVMNVPVIRDEKRTQTELSTLSQKKSVTFQINYMQSASRSIARQLIQSAQATFISKAS
jgi:hypothetical protein